MNIVFTIYYELQVPIQTNSTAMSLHIHVFIEPHVLPGSVLQVSEDEVNRVRCGLLLVFPATVCEGRISQRPY